MKRVWRNGGRVLSAILAAAMILTSLPVSVVTVYADETTSQVVTESVGIVDSAATVAEEGAAAENKAQTDEETVGESETFTEKAPADGEIPTDAGQTAESGTPADNETSGDGETTADDEAAIGGDTSTDGDSASDDSKTTTDGEAATDDETTDDEETTADNENTAADGQILPDEEATEEFVKVDETELSLAATAESDFTWDGTTITKYNGSATSVVIPDRATAIGDNAFAENTTLESVTMSVNLQTIEYSAFYDCTSLREVHLPDGLEIIGLSAFGSTALTEIELPDTVETLDEWAFSNCSSLIRVDLPEGLETIGPGAFWDCYSLQIINMPSSLKTIGRYAFGCNGQKSALVQITELRFEGDGNINIAYDAFDGDYNTRNIPVYCAEGSKVYNYFNGKKGFVVNPVVTEYSITYDLDGGTLPKGKTNPSTYDITKGATLVPPTKAGVVFAGWQVNDTETIITNNKISANTYTGQLTLTAL